MVYYSYVIIWLFENTSFFKYFFCFQAPLLHVVVALWLATQALTAMTNSLLETSVK